MNRYRSDQVNPVQLSVIDSSELKASCSLHENVRSKKKNVQLSYNEFSFASAPKCLNFRVIMLCRRAGEAQSLISLK